MHLEGVPEFPAFRQIHLEDRHVVEPVFSAFPTVVSERTFGSLYTWRNYEDRSGISQLDDHLIVSWFKPKFGKVILPPIGPVPDKVIATIQDSDIRPIHEFKGVYGLVGQWAAEHGPFGKVPVALRDEWDYVYRTGDLIGLEGPKYHTQRKELKKAASEYELIFEPMTRDHRQACLDLEEVWCNLKHCTFDKYSHAEDIALRDSIDHLDELGYFGGVALANGKLQALTVGEKLNGDTAVVHFEKANPMIRGLYQFINQQFCEKTLKGFEFVNREQDVGEPGLRRAKEGYHPHHFVEKHILLFD